MYRNSRSIGKIGYEYGDRQISFFSFLRSFKPLLANKSFEDLTRRNIGKLRKEKQKKDRNGKNREIIIPLSFGRHSIHSLALRRNVLLRD